MADIPPKSPILALEDISFGYAGSPLLFNGFSFALRQGERIGLHGPNGSGKTSFLRLLMGLETPQSGRLLFHGLPVDDAPSLHRLRCRIGFVLQNSDDQLFSPLVLEEVAFGPLNLGLRRREARDRAMETLESLGMAAYAEKRTHRLSGGEKKMVALASVLSMRPEALLLDEPTASLDDAARDMLVRILRERNITGIVVSHDRPFLEHTTDFLVRMRSGGIAWPAASGERRA